MPPARAEYKARSMGRSAVFFLLGGLCIAGAFGFVVYVMRASAGSPSIPVLIFAAVPLVAGGYFLFAGGNILSAEAMDAAGETGNVVVRTAAKALRLARPRA